MEKERVSNEEKADTRDTGHPGKLSERASIIIPMTITRRHGERIMIMDMANLTTTIGILDALGISP